MAHNYKNMFVVDVEADGPHPHPYNMINFGIVSVDNPEINFYGELRPAFMNDGGIKEARNVSGISWEKQLKFPSCKETMNNAVDFVKENSKGRAIFISDNNGFDWQFMNYYFHTFTDSNPFGFSSRRIGDIYSGKKNNLFKASEWKKYRKTTHDHNPVNDAMGNVEAFKYFMDK